MHLSSCVSLGRESSSSNSTTSHSFPSTFNVLCVPSIKRKHTHKVAQLHVDTRKAYYLQERYHKERIVAGYVVEQLEILNATVSMSVIPALVIMVLNTRTTACFAMFSERHFRRSTVYVLFNFLLFQY